MLFCASPNQLDILVEEAIKHFLNDEITKFSAQGISPVEMLDQQLKESGPYNEAVTEAIKKFTAKTENVEIQVAVGLSRIYALGPENEIQICFKMKDSFSGKVFALSDISTNIEKATHVDFTIRSLSKKIAARFQLKRYPSEHLELDQDSIISYLKKMILRKYGNMGDTNLIVLLQPTNEDATTPLDFKEIHKSLDLIKGRISFGEISFFFNANMKDLTLLRVFPDLVKSTIPLRLRTSKYQKLQSEWENEAKERFNKKNRDRDT